MNEIGIGAARSNAIGKSGSDECGLGTLEHWKMLTKGGVICQQATGLKGKEQTQGCGAKRYGIRREKIERRVSASGNKRRLTCTVNLAREKTRCIKVNCGQGGKSSAESREQKSLGASLNAKSPENTRKKTSHRVHQKHRHGKPRANAVETSRHHVHCLPFYKQSVNSIKSI